MVKKAVCAVLSAAMAFTLAACGTNAEPIPETPYESVAYQLYPAPEGGYVGDTMPFVTEDGTLELYYLYDTTQNGQGYHPVYKYSTNNFYEYKDHGKVLDFGLMSDPDPAIGTGSVLLGQDGQYHLFYTGHNDLGNSGHGKECVMHAVSSDRENWTKIPEDTFYCEENYSGDDFRDPNVFWNEEENCYWLLIAAREKSAGGVVAKYTSTDLKHWTICEPLYAPHDQYMLECPDLFKMGDHYYLTYSWDCVTYYAMSDSMNGPFEAPADNILDGRNFTFYAAKTGLVNDTRYLCGWVGRASLTSDSGLYDWAGNMVNHQLVQHDDGTLGVREPASFSEYFTEEHAYKAVKKNGKVKIKDGVVTLDASANSYVLADLGMRVPTMLLECDITLDADGCAGFGFGGTEEEPSYAALCLDAAKGLLHYEGTTIEDLPNWDPVDFTEYDFSKSQTHHVKLVCENEIVILYIDDAKALSTRNFSSINGAHIALFASEGHAQFSNLTMKTPIGK